MEQIPALSQNFIDSILSSLNEQDRLYVNTAIYMTELENEEKTRLRWQESNHVNKFNDYNLLKWALYNGNINLALSLLKNTNVVERINGNNVDNLEKLPALYFAIKLGNIEILKSFLIRGINLQLKLMKNFLPIHIALYFKNYVVVELFLIKMLSDLKDGLIEDSHDISLLHIACILDNENYVNQLLQIGDNIDKSISFDSMLWPGYTPLLLAVEFNNINLVKSLLNLNCDFTAKDKFGNTVLHIATDFHKYLRNEQLDKISKQIDMINFLLNHGADVNIKNLRGENILFRFIYLSKYHTIYQTYRFFHFWSDSERLRVDFFNTLDKYDQVSDLIKNFLTLGIDLNARDIDGYTILHSLTSLRLWSDFEYNLSEFLIINGINIDLQSVNGYTSCHLAAISDNSNKKISLLLKYNCDLNITDLGGHTPLHLLILHQPGSDQLINLLDSGADINKKNIEGRIVLHLLASVPNDDTPEEIDEIIERDNTFELNSIFDVEEFIKRGVSINITDNLGMTPLHLACMNKKFTLIKIFLDYGANINIEDNNKDTALTIAFKKQQSSQIPENLINRPREEWCQDTFCALIDHVILYNSLHYYVTEKNQEFFNKLRELIFPADYVDMIPDKCNVEINRLKQIKIDPYISVFDLLYKNPNQLTIHARKKKLIAFMVMQNVEEEYPMCGNRLKLLYKLGCFRMEKLREAFDALIILAGNIPYLCADALLLNMSEDSLDKIKEASTL